MVRWILNLVKNCHAAVLQFHLALLRLLEGHPDPVQVVPLALPVPFHLERRDMSLGCRLVLDIRLSALQLLHLRSQPGELLLEVHHLTFAVLMVFLCDLLGPRHLQRHLLLLFPRLPLQLLDVHDLLLVPFHSVLGLPLEVHRFFLALSVQSFRVGGTNLLAMPINALGRQGLGEVVEHPLLRALLELGLALLDLLPCVRRHVLSDAVDVAPEPVVQAVALPDSVQEHPDVVRLMTASKQAQEATVPRLQQRAGAWCRRLGLADGARVEASLVVPHVDELTGASALLPEERDAHTRECVLRHGEVGQSWGHFLPVEANGGEPCLLPKRVHFLATLARLPQLTRSRFSVAAPRAHQHDDEVRESRPQFLHAEAPSLESLVRQVGNEHCGVRQSSKKASFSLDAGEVDRLHKLSAIQVVVQGPAQPLPRVWTLRPLQLRDLGTEVR
mmetsp:Transcript_60104/g.167698  ORF Transcript_60104/g.167698 Transcript_60104/m.167698 type:complete len:444 (-) Transcript_60104:1115-2446(-)